MQHLTRTLLALALLGTPALADLQLVRSSHTDAYKSFGKDVPAKDSQTTVWMAKDRMHIESEGLNAIVRLDQKKLILLDTKEKTWMAVELPFDLKKYVAPEMAGMVDQMMGARALQAKVEAKDETKTIGAWNAKRFDITLSQAGQAVSSEMLWASKDIKADMTAYVEMYAAMMSLAPENKNLVVELKKVDGVPVRSEKTQTLNGAQVHTLEELRSATEKDAPAGIYDVPADFKEKAFDPMNGRGPKRPAGGGASRAGGG